MNAVLLLACLTQTCHIFAQPLSSCVTFPPSVSLSCGSQFALCALSSKHAQAISQLTAADVEILPLPLQTAQRQNRSPDISIFASFEPV
ncbi:hypothetical protein CCHR01_14442 [Colletotrichum chrysophilum]|uniref:Uncharacterized protein n=1 Tax=Colletotrichum chrysophilum TaxID=1836956 RepID=A0AAD9A7K1_9PEZI|nr:hypothetical protein CCHR01_14442 [Colletotrichum chrysophilum]